MFVCADFTILFIHKSFCLLKVDYVVLPIKSRDVPKIIVVEAPLQCALIAFQNYMTSLPLDVAMLLAMPFLFYN